MARISARQIEAFLAVMDHGSVTAAAKSLYVTQPSVSRMLSRFEQQAGFKAFDRKRGKLVPTAEAEIFLGEVKYAYQGIDYLNDVARELRHRRRGTLRIGTFPAYSNKWIADRLDRFVQNRDDALITVIPLPSSDIINVVSRQAIDIGIIARPTDRYGLRCEPLIRAPFVCILSGDHPLCEKEVIHASDLSGEDFISLSNLEKVRTDIDNVFASLGVERKIKIECAQASSICHMVAKGFGVSVLDSCTAEEYRYLGFEIRDFTPTIEYQIFIIESENRRSSGLVSEFHDLLLEEFADSI